MCFECWRFFAGAWFELDMELDEVRSDEKEVFYEVVAEFLRGIVISSVFHIDCRNAVPAIVRLN